MRLLIVILLLMTEPGWAQSIPNLRVPMVVSHLPESNRAMLRRPGAPKHNAITKAVCLNWKCRAVIGWHKTQQRNKFKRYKKPGIPRLKYLKADSLRPIEKPSKPIVNDTVATVIATSQPVKKDSVVAFTFNDVLFDTNKSELKSEFAGQLDSLTTVLNKYRNYEIRIVGHTDNSGIEKENARLSQQRAEAVASYLASKGINRDVITAEGMGSRKPVTSNHTPEGRQKNRRVEIFLSFQ